MIAVCSAFLTSFLAHDLTRSMLTFFNGNPYQIPSTSPLWLLCKPEIQPQFISLLCQSNLRFQAKCSKMQGFAVLIGNQAKLCGFILIFQIYLEMEGDKEQNLCELKSKTTAPRYNFSCNLLAPRSLAQLFAKFLSYPVPGNVLCLCLNKYMQHRNSLLEVKIEVIFLPSFLS